MEVEDPQESVDVSVVFALCSGRGRCGLAYVDLDEPERVAWRGVWVQRRGGVPFPWALVPSLEKDSVTHRHEF